jgi:hypothetical protein
MNIIKNLVRRMERLITGGAGARPIVPEAGTNHVKDPSLWTANSLYEREIGIEPDSARLFSTDGVEVIEPNTEDAILSGLKLSSSGVSSRYISISEGSFRLDGRTYYFVPPTDVSSTDAYVTINNAGKPRIDLIVAKPDLENFMEDQLCYGVDFEVVKGIVSYDPQAPNVPAGSILLGLVYVYPQSLGYTTLYPLSHSEGEYSTFPLPTIATTDFIRRMTREIRDWNNNTLYFTGQLG